MLFSKGEVVFAMDYMEQISLDISIRSYIRTVWFNLSQDEKNKPKRKQDIIKLFFTEGCDYYELMALFSGFPLTEQDVETLTEYAPTPDLILSISEANVRLALPHWTPSRYHTAPIKDVVEEIYRQLLCGKPVVKVYNSNLNPRNRKAYNDRYILLITTHKYLLVDINRKTTVQFQQDL